MQLHTEISGKEPLPNVATTGFFGGVYRGHRFLIEQVCEAAAVCGLALSVITFPVHPRRVMHPSFRFGLPTTRDERTALLAGTDINYYIMSDFTPDLAHFSAKQLMAILKDDYQVQILMVGYDHCFGHNRGEDFDGYVRCRQELGMEVISAQVYSSNEVTVSSLAIRHLLLEEDVSEITSCLGYRFLLNGTVVDSYHTRRKIGFLTANLCVSDFEKLAPVDGAYAVNVFLDEARHIGILSAGYRPTLNNGLDRSIKVRIFHSDADIYDQPMRIFFTRRTWPELEFDSIEELIEQLHEDGAEITAILSPQ